MLIVEIGTFATPEEAKLAAALLDDPTAQPMVNLRAEENGMTIGHILLHERQRQCR